MLSSAYSKNQVSAASHLLICNNNRIAERKTSDVHRHEYREEQTSKHPQLHGLTCLKKSPIHVQEVNRNFVTWKHVPLSQAFEISEDTTGHSPHFSTASLHMYVAYARSPVDRKRRKPN